MRINETNDQPIYINEDYLFVGNVYMKLFDQEILNIICEHGKELFTPKVLLDEIMIKLRQTSPFLQYTVEQLKSYCNEEQNKKFTDMINSGILSNTYTLYILYCNPLTDLLKLNWSVTTQIINDYALTPNCPAKRYFNNKCSIIIINSNIVSISNSIEFELELDHELNHLFEQFSNKKEVIDINKKLQQEILKYFKENNILTKEELNNDFTLHMFCKSEFYEMTANVCNVLSLYFKETNDIKLFNMFNEMLTEDYLKSNKFKQFPETVKGAIIFAFICKKFNIERWKIILSYVRGQLNLKGLTGSIKYYANEILKCFNKLINKER